MNPQNKWDIYIDGASKGNPGESGIGVIISKNDEVKKNISQYIGITTNNVAEYMALIYGLQEALIQNIRNIHINTDSELLYKQLTGDYKVKDENLKILNGLAKHLLSGFTDVDITNIPREKNKGADRLASSAIEKRPVLLKKTKKIKASQDDQFLDFV
jgi:ribonuclease HI